MNIVNFIKENYFYKNYDSSKNENNDIEKKVSTFYFETEPISTFSIRPSLEKVSFEKSDPLEKLIENTTFTVDEKHNIEMTLEFDQKKKSLLIN